MGVIASGTISAGVKKAAETIASGQVNAAKKASGQVNAAKKSGGSGKVGASAKKDSPPRRGVESADTRGGRREQDTLAARAGAAVAGAAKVVGERPRIQARPSNEGVSRALAAVQEGWRGAGRAVPIERPAAAFVPEPPPGPAPTPRGAMEDANSTRDWARLLTAAAAAVQPQQGPLEPTGAFTTPRGTPGALQPGEIRGFHAAPTPQEVQAEQEARGRAASGFNMATAKLANTEVGADLGIQPTNVPQGPVSPTWEATRQQALREAGERKEAKEMYGLAAADMSKMVGSYVSPYDIYKHHRQVGYESDLQGRALELQQRQNEYNDMLYGRTPSPEMYPYLEAIQRGEMTPEDVERVMFDEPRAQLEAQLNKLRNDPQTFMREAHEQGTLTPTQAAQQGAMASAAAAYAGGGAAGDARGKMWEDATNWSSQGAPYIGGLWPAVPGLGPPGPMSGMQTKNSYGTGAPFSGQLAAQAWNEWQRRGYTDPTPLMMLPRNELDAIAKYQQAISRQQKLEESRLNPEDVREMKAIESAFAGFRDQPGGEYVAEAIGDKFRMQQAEISEYAVDAGSKTIGLYPRMVQQLVDRGLAVTDDEGKGVAPDVAAISAAGLDAKHIQAVVARAKSLDEKAASSAGLDQNSLIDFTLDKNLAFGDLGGPGPNKGRDKGRQRELMEALKRAHQQSPYSQRAVRGMQLSTEDRLLPDEPIIDNQVSVTTD